MVSYKLLGKMALRCMLYPLRVFRIKNNRVLLHNHLSASFSDNMKYIALELDRRGDTGLQVLFDTDKEASAEQIRALGFYPVRSNSLKYYYYALTSKVFVTNSGGLSYVPFRNKQFIMNTWHGGGAYKYAGKDLYSDSPEYVRDLKRAAKVTNLFLSTNRRFSEVIAKAMFTDREKFWEIGMPRNDILLQQDAGRISSIKERIGLNPDDKLVLFCPTYRKPDDNYFDKSIAIDYGIDAVRVCGALKRRFGGNWVFARRYHPNVVNKDIEAQHEGVIDLSEYDDMQELLLAADVMINDFSSSIWDFMLTGKPCFMFAVDMQHYIEHTKVYTPIEEWPFPKAADNNRLEHEILNFDEATYKRACRKHYEALGGCESGKAAKLAADRILEVCRRQ